MRCFKAFVFGVAVLTACIAQGRDPVPVYGPARMAVEDEDLLDTTILPLGTLAVSPGKIWKVRAGDGLTPGGIPIHPEGCVTGFVQVAHATTNLNMHSYSITFGPWAMHGDANEWDLQYGTEESWLRLVRDSGQAYLAYDFTIVDAMHYRFQLAWSGDGYDFPVLQVATNLVDGYATVDPADVTYSRPDTSHLVIDYAVPGEYVFLSFRLFASDRLSTGAYFGVPVHAEYGFQAVGSLSVTGRVESYYDEHAEETRDRYVPGSITIDGEEVATTGAVDAVAADLAAHCADTNNPHGVTFEQVYDAGEPNGISWSQVDGVWSIGGFGRNIEVETGTFFGDWSFQDRPKFGTNGLATTGEVASAVAAHACRTNNPHSVTAEQIGALPVTPGLVEPGGQRWWVVDDNVDFEGAVAFRDTVEALGIQATSLKVGAGTCSNLAELATTQSVASVERRLGVVEEGLEEYWCKWTTNTLSAAATNWIPTNWPANTVYCFVDIRESTFRIVLPNWAPSSPRKLVFYILVGGGAGFNIYTANGQLLVNLGSSGAVSRILELSYRQDIGWSFTGSTAVQPWIVVGGARRDITGSALPEDSRFAPVIQ